MSATVAIGPVEATLADSIWRWTCPDKRIEQVLNGLLDPLGPSGSDPNPALHAARAAIEAIGGELVRYDPTEYEPGRVY